MSEDIVPYSFLRFQPKLNTQSKISVTIHSQFKFSLIRKFLRGLLFYWHNELKIVVIKRGKKTGKTRVYESTPHYDPVTKQSRPKRKYLGTLEYKTNRCILPFLPYLRQHSHIHLIYPVTEQADVLPVMTDDED